jgi:hypothetical protein
MGHHLILGQTIDFITDKQIIDTDDERIRQSIARFLVNEKGYAKTDIEPKIKVELICGNEKAIAVLDFAVQLGEKKVMIIQYGPGSIVSRHRPAIAWSRILCPYEIPFAVVTNGIDADILDVATGVVIGNGLSDIASRQGLEGLIQNCSFRTITRQIHEKEIRFLFAYEAIEHSAECDDEFCIIKLTESIQ